MYISVDDKKVRDLECAQTRFTVKNLLKQKIIHLLQSDEKNVSFTIESNI